MNLIGERFGRLTVVSDAKRKGYVVCKCDCGNTKTIRATSLTKQKQPTRSCGCIHKEAASNVGTSTISANAKQLVATNRAFRTNFAVIESTKLPKNNTSGVRGVSWDSRRQKWVAKIGIHSKNITLGRFDRMEDAVIARRCAEDEYFQPLIQQKYERSGENDRNVQESGRNRPSVAQTECEEARNRSDSEVK